MGLVAGAGQRSAWGGGGAEVRGASQPVPWLPWPHGASALRRVKLSRKGPWCCFRAELGGLPGSSLPPGVCWPWAVISAWCLAQDLGTYIRARPPGHPEGTLSRWPVRPCGGGPPSALTPVWTPQPIRALRGQPPSVPKVRGSLSVTLGGSGVVGVVGLARLAGPSRAWCSQGPSQGVGVGPEPKGELGGAPRGGPR